MAQFLVIFGVTMRWAAVTLLLLSVFVPHMAAAAGTGLANEDVVVARVLELSNEERVKVGLAPLTLNPQLNDAAQSYSQVLANGSCFEHTCGPVPDFVDRAGQAGYTDFSALGENIAAGYPSPEAVVAGWMASPGHRANILSPAFSETGIGLVSNGSKTYQGMYWTQEFGSRAFASATVAAAAAD
jgi:uncharacterized protein YkwD